MSMCIVTGESLTIFDPEAMVRWTNGHTTVTPLGVIGESMWVRNERDGSKLNYKHDLFVRSFRPRELLQQWAY